MNGSKDYLKVLHFSVVLVSRHTCKNIYAFFLLPSSTSPMGELYMTSSFVHPRNSISGASIRDSACLTKQQMQRVQALAYRSRRKNIVVSPPCCKPSFLNEKSEHSDQEPLRLINLFQTLIWLSWEIKGCPPIKPRICQSFSDSDLTFKVDLVIWSELQDHFKRIIESGSVVIQSAPHKSSVD